MYCSELDDDNVSVVVIVGGGGLRQANRIIYSIRWLSSSKLRVLSPVVKSRPDDTSPMFGYSNLFHWFGNTTRILRRGVMSTLPSCTKNLVTCATPSRVARLSEATRLPPYVEPEIRQVSPGNLLVSTPMPKTR